MSSTTDPYASARAHLKEHGWARIPSVLTKAEAADTLSTLRRAQATAEARGESTHLPWIDPNASNIRIFHLLELDPLFRSLIAHPTAIDMVRTALGSDNFLISNFTANIARPGSRSMCLHSDMSIVFPEPWTGVWALNIIWCLTDVHRDNGATLHIPGSHAWTRRADVPADAPARLVPFEAEAGDVLVMDGRVWHTSGANVTADEERALLFAYYTAPFVRQQVNWTAKLPREVQEGLGEEMREWLGLNPTANIGATGDLRYMEVQYPEYAAAGKEGEEKHGWCSRNLEG